MKANNNLFSAAMVAEWLDGELIGDANLPIAAVSIDSRRIGGQALFVALAGRYTDGHRYVADVLADGNNAALIEADYARREGEHLHKLTRSGGALCIVPDTRRALLRLAQRHIERFPAMLRVAITGSVGKTATKELTAAILSRNRPTFLTRENFNSDIGLPLESFRITADRRCAVFEMGMNRPGEIADLAAVVQPDVALITNIGRAHIGELGEPYDRGNCAREGSPLFLFRWRSVRPSSMRTNHCVNCCVADLRGRTVWFGARSTAGFEGFESRGLAGSRLYWNGHTIEIRLVGDWQLSNILAAIAIARELSCSDEQIVAGLESVGPLFGRGEIIEGQITIIQDCYNASPESTNAAVGFLQRLAWSGRKVCVLGPLKELGDWSAAVQSRGAGERLSGCQCNTVRSGRGVWCGVPSHTGDR